jgi:hypothetical protein
MIKPIIWVGVYCLPLLLALPTGRFSQYHRIESYEIRPGILLTPVYAPDGELCKVSIERRRYSKVSVDLDADIPKEQIDSFFDELAPQQERGKGGLGLPAGTEVTETDGGTRTTLIPYENVSLEMYGKTESRNYAVAIITWNKRPCAAK